MEMKKSGQGCGAINCTNSRVKCPGKSFYRFPKEEKRCKQWVQNTRRQDLMGKSSAYLYSSVVLCEDHFENSQFLNIYAPRKRLIWNAVPTVFQVPNPPAKVTMTRRPPKRMLTEPGPCQDSKRKKISPASKGENKSSSPAEVEIGDQIPTTSSIQSPKKELKRKIQNLRNKIVRLKKDKKPKSPRPKERVRERKAKVIKELSHVFSGPTLAFIATQIHLSSKKARGVRWSEKDIAIALSLFHTSPKAYQLLKKIFVLPSFSTLRRVMQAIQIYPGFSDTIMDALKNKVSSLPQNSDVCALVFDEMSIKESVVYNRERDEIEGLEDFGFQGRTHFVANHATVFMARGLMSDWKQRVRYFLSSGPMESKMLHTLLLQCIDKLEESGLKVKVVIADQGSNNRKVFETLCGATETKPFCLHNGNRLHVMYDPPHLLKNVRNNLKKSGFTIGDTEICWSHIEDFYNFDVQNKIRIPPKLTPKHIALPPFRFTSGEVCDTGAVPLCGCRFINISAAACITRRSKRNCLVC